MGKEKHLVVYTTNPPAKASGSPGHLKSGKSQRPERICPYLSPSDVPGERGGFNLPSLFTGCACNAPLTTHKTTVSPLWISNRMRIFFGMVHCPLLVTVTV